MGRPASGGGVGPTDHCELCQVRDIDGLGAAQRGDAELEADTPDGKWTSSLVPDEALATFASLTETGAFTRLQDWGETTLGMVTGNNRYFALSERRARDLGLKRCRQPSPCRLGHAASPWGSLSAREPGGSWRRPAHPHALSSVGRAVTAARRYIAEGERLGVPAAYKCRMRSPWWRVPLVPTCDVLVTYMNADTPRLCANEAGVHHLNSVHGLYLRLGLKDLGKATLPLASLNSATLLGAETVGRAYGGGMLKLEPREADRLPVPSPDTLAGAADALAGIKQVVADRLRARRLQEAVEIVDTILLEDALGLRSCEVEALREAHSSLRARRIERGTTVRPRRDTVAMQKGPSHDE